MTEIKPEFEIDKVLGKTASLLFGIDKYSTIILSVIAKHGPLNKKEISEHGFRRSHNTTEDVVRYRLYSSKNKTSLTESNFVLRQTGKRIRNIKGRKESTYRLLFKGFLASLARTRFDDCYIVKKYLGHFPTWTKQYNIPSIALQAIKFDLALFMLKYVIVGSKFNHLVDVDTNRESLNYEDPITNPTFTPQTRNMQYESTMFRVRYWYHVYSQVLNKLLEKISKDKNHDDEAEKVVAYINYWYQWFFRVQFDSTPFSPKNIPLKMTSQIMPVGRTINIRDVNHTAKEMLREFNIRTKLDLDETPVFFS